MFLVGAQLLMVWGVLFTFRKVEERRVYLKTLEAEGKDMG